MHRSSNCSFSLALVPIKPLIGCLANIFNCVRGLGWDQNFLSNRWPDVIPIEAQFYIAFLKNDQLVSLVHKVRPDLTRRVDKDTEGKASLSPAR